MFDGAYIKYQVSSMYYSGLSDGIEVLKEIDTITFENS